MATKKSATTSSGFFLGLSQSVTLKDLITVISVAVSLTLAWGVFSTRITLLEKEVIAIKASDAERVSSINALEIQLRKLEAREQDDQQFIDNLYRAQGRPLPRRSAN